MKKFWIIFLISVQVLLGAASGKAEIIDDSQFGANTYIGGYVSSGAYYYGRDVIDTNDLAVSQAKYGVDAMTVTFEGSKMIVKLTGPFFSSSNASRADSSGLFISDSGWQVANKSANTIDPSATGLYPNDVFGTMSASGTPTQGEGWDYVVGLKNVQGFGYGVYNLDWAGIVWTTGCSGNLGRCDQAYGGGFGTLPAVSAATITRDASGMTYTILDDSFLAGKTIGLHWTMDCGNDVVEGEVKVPQVPEPGTLLLLGFGLAGLAACRRRAKK